MFPLWEVAIAPVLAAARARKVVEIGALRGNTTQRMLEFLGPEAALHVIDPAPDFDPTEHERVFAGRYLFHRDLSHNVLPQLEPMDAALVDGDHNWYTVYHELKMLAATARDAGQPLPLLVLHDVGWPYGRRDLYYAPERVPEEHRQPWARKGMRPGVRELLPSGGVNPTMCNAEVEGGPRNGVMTALDDFIAEHDRPIRLVVVPTYFGLAIAADEDRLARSPDLAAVLDRLEGAEGQRGLLRVGEEMRLRALGNLHTRVQRDNQARARAARRYLELLKGALLEERYLENEIRRHRDSAVAHGESGDGSLPYATLGRRRLDHLERCLDTIRADRVPGDLLERRTGRGGAAIFLRGYLSAHEVMDRKVWISDEFRTTPAPARTTGVIDETTSEVQADVNLVREAFERFDLLDDQLGFLQGTVAETLTGAAFTEVALLRLGQGIGATADQALEVVYPRLALGAYVVVDDHADPECAAAVEAFRARHGVTAPLEAIDWSAVAWRKTERVAAESDSRPAALA